MSAPLVTPCFREDSLTIFTVEDYNTVKRFYVTFQGYIEKREL